MPYLRPLLGAVALGLSVSGGLPAQEPDSSLVTLDRLFASDEFTPEFLTRTIQTMIDIQGDYGDLIRASNMPPSYVILDRVFWGMSALFGRLHASGNWRALLAEYRKGEPPSTELGRIEEEWRLERAVSGAQ